MSLGQGAATVVGALVVALLVVVDVVLANDKTAGNTPSEVVRWATRYTAVVPFGLGVLMGHWYHPDDDLTGILGARSALYLLIIGVVIGVAGLFIAWKKRNLEAWPWAIAGAVLGVLLWPV